MTSEFAPNMPLVLPVSSRTACPDQISRGIWLMGSAPMAALEPDGARVVPPWGALADLPTPRPDWGRDRVPG
jgi:hypothetical protein